MMNTIKQGIITILVFFTVFFFMPLVSFASSFSDTFEEGTTFIQGIDFSVIQEAEQNKSWFLKVHRRTKYSLNESWTDTFITNNRGNSSSYPAPGYYGVYSNQRIAIYIANGETTEGFNNGFIVFRSGNEVKRFEQGFCGLSIPFNYKQNRANFWNWLVSYDTNIPIFVGPWNDINNQDSAVYKWIMNGDLDNTSNVIDHGFSGPASGSSLGYIKNVNYSHNNNTSSQGFYEIVSWGSSSTTGVDLTEKINGYDRYRVEFALRDQSTIAKNSFYNGFQSNEDILEEWDRTKPDPVLPFDINSIVSRLAGGLAGGLAEHVYPYGGTNRAIKQGLITTAPSYNKMISMGDTPASNRRYAFNALHEYTTSENFAAEAPEIHSSLTGVYNTNLPNFLKGGWFESIVSNSNYYNIADYHLSYNIYARIVDTKDKINGNWLLIDKHGQPIGAQDDRMNGGYTSKPIKLPDFNPGTDWTDAPDDVDVPDDEIEDNDTVKDEPLGTGYDDGSDNSGSGTTNIYNNYTYNYDNRSWIENHYDNETVQDANEGIDWLKLFSGFFSIFLILFGPFLPEWAVVLVTVATPIILGLAIFKVIKGIIPFV